MLIQAENLTTFMAAVCGAAGSGAEESAEVAANLVEANLKGHDSHGVGLMPTYVNNMVEDRLGIGQHVQVISDVGPILVLDGNLGFGQVIGREAMELGIPKAKEHGVAVVALRNTHHLGRIGAWGEMCAAAGLISIHYVNVTGHTPVVAPFGGSDARFVTNPYCTALPAQGDQPPVILDMATSQVAMGKIRVAHNKGVEAPEGALIDSTGRPTRDPGVMYSDGPHGALRSMGLHKGYGLAFICEMMAGALTGGGTCLPERYHRQTIINNMMTIILDPAAIDVDEVFGREVTAMTDHITASPPAPGVEKVMVPGDPERKSAAARGRDGIPIDDQTWQELVDTAHRVGLSDGDIDAIVRANR